MQILKIYKEIQRFPEHVEKVRHQFDLILQALGLYLDDYEEVTMDFTNPNTEVEASHSLQKVPNRFTVSHNITGDPVFPSGTAWDRTRIYFMCQGANNTAIIKVWARK